MTEILLYKATKSGCKPEYQVVGSTMVDSEDYKMFNQYRWSLQYGYATRIEHPIIDGKMRIIHIRLHREIMELKRNPGNSGELVDHINHDKLDNRKINLRIATNQQNQMNRKIQGGSSKYKGVSWHKSKRKCIARICLDGKLKHLGYFDNEGEAALSYNKAAKDLFKDYAKVNKVVGNTHDNL